jgi:hypothetical protein
LNRRKGWRKGEMASKSNEPKRESSKGATGV